MREIHAREERKRKRDVYTRRITKYTWRKYIKVWMRGTHSEIEHVCTDDCEFPRERRFVLWALLLLAGKGKTKELVILSVLGFSSRGYFLRFTRIMRPFDLNRNASRVSSPFSVSILRARVKEREREERERERKREQACAEYIPLMNAYSTGDCSCTYVFKDISRVSIIKRICL